jgi:hypothetical protein
MVPAIYDQGEIGHAPKFGKEMHLGEDMAGKTRIG